MVLRRKKKLAQSDRRGRKMKAFSFEQVAMLEALLQQDGSGTAIRDLALLRVGVDSMLRSSDVVSLTLRDVHQNGSIVSEFAVKQKKTKKMVSCDLSERTRNALAAWLMLNPAWTGDTRVFAITTRQHQRIVKYWCSLLNLDGELYSTHSLRRTKPAYLYAQTKNLAAVKELLGHKSIAATGEYLGITGEDARALARQYQI